MSVIQKISSLLAGQIMELKEFKEFPRSLIWTHWSYESWLLQVSKRLFGNSLRPLRQRQKACCRKPPGSTAQQLRGVNSLTPQGFKKITNKNNNKTHFKTVQVWPGMHVSLTLTKYEPRSVRDPESKQ